MSVAWRLTDLDESPELIESAVQLVQRTARGRDHIVAGDVQRIGFKPTPDDFPLPPVFYWRYTGKRSLVFWGSITTAMSK